MNEHRIRLTRILALNWYGFRQLIDVADDTLISGAFATGKSALLDLMQYVLLGEHARFNRAAAGEHRGRRLVGYCLCDTNTLRDGEPHYTRRSGVTLIGLEFTWPGKEEPRRETWGIRIEFESPTSDPRQTYFFAPTRLAWADVTREGRELLDDEEFRTYIRREFGRDCLFARQVDYLAEMATPRHLYFDREQMNRTTPKAMAFEVEDDVERFIREFILEQSPVDVREVRSIVHEHRHAQDLVQRHEDQFGFLRRVGEHHQVFAQARRAEALGRHLRCALEHAQVQERLERHEQALAALQAQQAEDRRQLAASENELAEVAALVAAVRFEVARDPQQVELEKVRRRKTELEEEIEQLRAVARSVRERLALGAQRWATWLHHAAGLRLEGLSGWLQAPEELLRTLRLGSEAEGLAALAPLAASFNEAFRAVGELLQPLREQQQSAQGRLQLLARDLEALERSEMPGAFPLLAALKARFGERDGQGPKQLGRLLEVKPTEHRWWPALELELGSNRFAVFIDKAQYREAVEVLRRTPPGREFEALVNPFETEACHGKTRVLPNSLAAKVEAAHPGARVLADLLLGEIVCVETVENLEQCESTRAITPEGVSKHAPARRRLKPAQEVPLTLGREGLRRMRDRARNEQADAQAAAASLQQQIADVHAWLDSGMKFGLGDSSLPDRSSDLPKLQGLERERNRLAETEKLLTTPEREERLGRLRQHENRQAALHEQLGGLRREIDGFRLKATAEEEALAGARVDLEAAQVSLQASRSQMPTDLLDAEIRERLAALRAQHDAWRDRLAAADQLRAEAGVQAAAAREQRNRERGGLAFKHPEYRTDFDLEDDDNARWDERLRLLAEHELPRFRVLAAEKRREWEDRLKGQVLDKLNERLREAAHTIRLLRDYLDRDVGKYRYRVTQRRDQALGAIWHLLDTGLEPTDPLVDGIKAEAIERAKAELMAAVETADGNDERARRLLDYRYYHHYELQMVPADRPDGPPISLNRSARSMSGGENQAPFFISMLAAFHRVYDLGSRHYRQNLGLVIMDEAFSKLSGDGVEDCLDLARNFELQLVMAFPIDKLGLMAPYAQTIVLCRKEEQRDSSGYVTRIDIIPTLLTPEQVQEALA